MGHKSSRIATEMWGDGQSPLSMVTRLGNDNGQQAVDSDLCELDERGIKAWLVTSVRGHPHDPVYVVYVLTCASLKIVRCATGVGDSMNDALIELHHSLMEGVLPFTTMESFNEFVLGSGRSTSLFQPDDQAF